MLCSDTDGCEAAFESRAESRSSPRLQSLKVLGKDSNSFSCIEETVRHVCKLHTTRNSIAAIGHGPRVLMHHATGTSEKAHTLAS